MPGPFPGMDPYLEHRALWPAIRQRLITYIADDLNTRLPPKYVADIGERVYLVQPGRDIYPDAFVLEAPSPQRSADHPEGGAAVAVASDPPWVVTVEPVEVREVFVRIVTTPDESRVVTAIEVLSPSNKTVGSPGRRLYQRKQQEVLESETHLLEIDLLHHGEHTVAVPRESLTGMGEWDYLVCLHRAGQEGRYELWAVPLRERLPRVHVPLAGDDPDVVLDLQAVFDHCYDAGGFARRLDYRRDLPVSLPPDDAEWATRLLRERGLRT